MLPSNLLITRKYRDRIYPVYAKLDGENLDVAALVIQTYENHVGRTKGELAETIKEIEDMGYDYRYVRGLSVLLDRRCQLESKASIDPVEVRREVFGIAHEAELPTTKDARSKILREVGLKLGIETKELEESLYADMEDNLLIMDFKAVEPETLIKEYNLGLTQTLLFYSTELIFTTQGNWQEIFRQIKWLGLIYTIQKHEETFQMRVDGPLSLFRLSRRYGTRIAKLLPAIIRSKEWNVRAKVLRHRAERRLLNLELNSEKHGEFIISSRLSRDKESYDSEVEEDFAHRFRALKTGWELVREPDPIPVNNHVMIPDFGFHKAGLKIYLEVMGFWTPQYLKGKIKKLEGVIDIDMIIAADKNLACQKLDEIGKRMNVVYYKRKIPLKPIIAYLKSKESHLASEQTKLLQSREIQIQDPVIEVKDLAKKLDVLEEAVRNILQEREIQGFKQLGDLLIKESKLAEIRDIIESRLDKGELSFDEASDIIRETGGKMPTSILNALGYKVEWEGIDPRLAKVQRK
ncbi:MAG: DUF790 family protein [Candidatus Hodarchaeota archaeon]